MNASHVFEERSKIHFIWLIRLRWMAVIGQSVTIILSQVYARLDLPLKPLLFVVLLSAASNISAVQLSKKVHPTHFMSWILLLDVLLLTFLLYFSGGPMNPFSSLYLVHIVLGLIILQGLWTWSVMLLALLCFAGLFYFHRAIPNFHAHHDMSAHLQGMWVALGITSMIIVYFVKHILSSVRELENQVEDSRESLRRREQLHSLGTLAAGAAHELSTPLSTIALVSKELERKLSGIQPDDRIKQDVGLIRKEVDRCKTILMHMSAYSAQQPGEEMKTVNVREFLQVFKELDASRVDLVLSEHEAQALLHIPVQAVRICLQNLVQNALDASQDRVIVRTDIVADKISFSIQDHGSGMSAETLKKLGEPFFTTKEPGKGMGLGVFIARSIVEQIGGHMQVDSTLGQGTVVTVMLPMSMGTSA